MNEDSITSEQATERFDMLRAADRMVGLAISIDNELARIQEQIRLRSSQPITPNTLKELSYMSLM